MCLQLAFLRKSDSFSHRFIEEKSSFEYGQVNHALAAAMRALVKEHLILVSQLEQLHRQGLLSLQKLWFYIQPAMRTMDILASLGASCPGAWGSGWQVSQHSTRCEERPQGPWSSRPGQVRAAKAPVAPCVINLREESPGSSYWSA